jgi:hypothetical protein
LSVSTRENDVTIELDLVVSGALLNSGVNFDFERVFEVLVHKLRVEEHFRSHEAFVADIAADHISVQSLVGKLFEPFLL